MNRRRFLRAAGLTAAGVAARLDAVQGPVDTVRTDTTELQSALDRGGQITLDGQRRYVVAPQGDSGAALILRSDTDLDLAGATLELAPCSPACLILADRKSQTRNVHIHGGRIIGNGSKQPEFSARVGVTPTLYLPNCDGLQLTDLRMHDTYHYSIHAEGDDCVAKNISVDGAIGGGIHLSGARWHIDKIDVRNVTFINAELCEGNPFIARLYDSVIGTVRCENFAFGVKFQDGCSCVTVDSITALGGPNNEPHPNPLVKIQGMNDTRGKHFNQHLRIKSIVAEGGSVSGLYIIYSNDVQIDHYAGRNNCRLPYHDQKYQADVLLLESDDVRFGLLEAGGVRHCGLWTDAKARNIDVQQLKLVTDQETARPRVEHSQSVSIHRWDLVGFAK